jgi:hexosaminidase
MRRVSPAVVLCLTLIPFVMADTQARLDVAPMPASVQLGAGSLVVDPSFSVGIEGYKEPRLDRAVQRFLGNLSRQTAMPLNMRLADPAQAALVIRADHPSKPVQEVDEDESYTLDVTASRARLTAPNPLGILHGLETLLQLIETTPDGFRVPAVRIQDQPRFRWRGLLIDVCRHFIPLDVLKRNLDGMAAIKMNVLHLHLSENQGFRVESEAFPKLHEMGSDGFYYTQAEIRDLVEYARERGIRVVPEFDMPGHTTSWFVGYPEIASAPGPYTLDRKWGVFDPAMDPTREQTYRFLDEFIREMAELFPDRYFHTGGDEVNGKQWDANPKIQEFKRLHHLNSNHDLQQYFNERIQKIVAKHHKIMIGWDEILSPDLPKDIVIQSWRGPDSLAQAARLGYDGILSAGYYLDLMAHASDHYQVDPLAGAAAALAPEEKARILGGEACMWSEYVSPDNIDSRIWPRTVAIAERLWSPETAQDVDSMYRRMGAVSWRLEWLGLTHRSSYVAMLGRLAGTDDIAALRVLADVVEPDKGYSRPTWASSMGIVFTSATPLNHLTDAVAPESEGAQEFTTAVNSLVSSKFSDTASEAQVRAQLVLWRDNYARLQPLLDRSFLLKEVTPLSRDLASLGAVGLQALDYIDKGGRAPEAWSARQLAIIDQAKKPRANLVLATASAVQVLVEASAESAQGTP